MRESHYHLCNVRLDLSIQQLKNQVRINIEDYAFFFKLWPWVEISKFVHILLQLTKANLIVGNSNIHKIVYNSNIGPRNEQVHFFLFFIDGVVHIAQALNKLPYLF